MGVFERGVLDGVAPADLTPFAGGTVAWCCLAGIAGESDFMPFLWSPNLDLDDEDFSRPVDPANPVDWSDKVKACPPLGRDAVVLVRKGGAMQIVKREQLTDAVFFGGAAPRHPEALQILRPR